MHCTEWHYRCRCCDHRFILPGADLSFVYGTVLGVSPSPEAVFFCALGDPAYIEIQALVSRDGRTAGLAPVDAGQLIRSVVGRVFDPDSRGATFDFNRTYPCPQCASIQIELLGETGVRWPGTVRQATHLQWDALPSCEKATAIGRVLSDLLR